MTVKELRAYLDKFPDTENVRFSAADVKKRDIWPNCQIGSKRISGPMPMICLELHERFWWPAEDDRWSGMWIPVAEKLPKPGRRYLTTMRYKESGIVGVYDAVYGSDGVWHGENYKPISERLKVIAWMPLPEPYENGDEK